MSTVLGEKEDYLWLTEAEASGVGLKVPYSRLLWRLAAVFTEVV
jgi:hypothetical protein